MAPESEQKIFYSENISDEEISKLEKGVLKTEKGVITEAYLGTEIKTSDKDISGPFGLRIFIDFEDGATWMFYKKTDNITDIIMDVVIGSDRRDKAFKIFEDSFKRYYCEGKKQNRIKKLEKKKVLVYKKDGLNIIGISKYKK